ncbi:MAG TPA: hypothetical protein PLD25_22415 [Chloroflexota bacterium]|nr:hypothetical protein [Chloroflexota bacterium]HUM70288.1 hypothetical protein [Chloroflexota bacterium]
MKRKNHEPKIIDATFAFQDGKIMRHQDHFDLWPWARLALGSVGIVLRWSPPIQNKVRATSMGGLKKFITDHQEYQ